MTVTTSEETALETRTEETTELVPTASAAAVEQEIKAAITVALRFPRNEDRAFEKLMRSCRRPAFAEDAAYSFPRAGADITGPSIYLAREAARVWGNIRHGLNVVADDDETRTIEAWAWDLETNTKVFAQDTFKKLIYRKKGGWIKPDERDLRELTNRRGAILKRNCILEIMPTDLIDEARKMAVETLQKGASADPEAARKKIIMAFSSIGTTPEMLEQKLGHPLAQCSPAEIAELRQIYKSIADGNSTWGEYVKDAQPAPSARVSMEDLKPSREENRGHGQEGLDRVTSRPEQQSKAADAAMAQAKETMRRKAETRARTNKSEPAGNPNYAESEPDPFGPAGDLFTGRDPGQEG